ncbi:MAG: hypothetical protein VKI93_04410 [Synechococcus sp.]|nr:hypothetical protein [Synechococcus sp.]
MPSAAGAYAESTGTIYLNEDWVRAAKQDEIVKVLTEEYGHHLDALLKNKDTQGDEGEVFAELLVSTKEIHSRNNRRDKTHHPDGGEIKLHQAVIQVEFASTNPDGSVQLDGTEGRHDGSASNDTIYGSALADEVWEKNGHDWIDGGDGEDSIDGGNQKDTIYGGDGNDYLHGRGHNDTLYGGDGNDTLYGGNHSDVVYGEAGNDRLINNKGNDTLRGRSGDDTIRGGKGDDIIKGGRGADRIHLSRGQDQILDFKPQQGDRLLSKNKFAFEATERDGNLILIDINYNSQITLYNISLEAVLAVQPELFT